MNKVSHMAQIRAQYAYNRAQVLWLTKMSDGMLSQFQFDTGLQWLTMYTTDSEDILRWILSQPLIWKWWLNEWHRRDDEYLPLMYETYKDDPEGVIAVYRAMHQESFVQHCIAWTLLEDGYTRRIGEVMKNKPAL